VTLRILSLAEADLLNGFRFYERQSSGVGLYFLESLNSDIESLRLYAGIHRKVFGYRRMLSKPISFCRLLRICTSTRSGFGAFWIADAIRIGSSFG
jgi:hypothetical protein